MSDNDDRAVGGGSGRGNSSASTPSVGGNTAAAGPARRTSRGFGVYAEGVDHYGESWSVSESSLAFTRAVWCGRDDVQGQGARMHLTEDGARAVIAGLQLWLADQTTTEPPEEDR